LEFGQALKLLVLSVVGRSRRLRNCPVGGDRVVEV
jgi:hypothetical protein